MLSARHVRLTVGASLAVLALYGCGGSGVASTVKAGVRAADDTEETVTKIRVKDPDTGKDKWLTYVKDGADWVLKGCEIYGRAGQGCTEPEAPTQVTPP